MGTRNLTIVRMNKKVVVAQYGQWDGYPTGQGITIAKFLAQLKPTFKSHLKKVRWAKKGELQKRWVEVGADPKSDLVSMDIAEKHRNKYPWLSRDVGAEVLNLIQQGRVDILDNAIGFLKDGVFCEYAYEIDLDKEIVHVYTGGKEPHKTYTFKQFTVAAMKKLEAELREDI